MAIIPNKIECDACLYKVKDGEFFYHWIIHPAEEDGGEARGFLELCEVCFEALTSADGPTELAMIRNV